MSGTYSPCLGLHNKEVLKGLGAINRCRKV